MAKTGGPADIDEVSIPVALALAMTMAGGLVLTFLWVVDDPPTLITAAAFVLWLAGAVLVGVFATREARRAGDSIGEALGRGFKTLLKWMWAFLP